MKFRIVFWDVLPCKITVDRRFRGACCLHHQEAARTSETSADNYFTRQYIPEDNSELQADKIYYLHSTYVDIDSTFVNFITLLKLYRFHDSLFRPQTHVP
jgi:hypothetical protein